MTRIDSIGELRMLSPLLDLLRWSGRARPDTLFASELAWRGRRIDLATITRSGIMSAYELKLGSFGRGFEQAIYNRLSFDRSWLVIDKIPSLWNVQQAERQGVGVIVVQDKARVIVASPLLRNEPIVRHRLMEKIRMAGSINV